MSLSDAFALLDRASALCDNSEALGRALLFAGQRAAVKMEEVAGEYPEPAHKPLATYYDRVMPEGKAYKSKFKSMKQQRKVFALIKAGKVPYRRTGRLGASLTSDAQLTGTGVRLTAGTNAPGAKYPLGKPGERSHYFEGVWEPLQAKVDANAAEIIEVFSAALIDYVRGYMKGRG